MRLVKGINEALRRLDRLSFRESREAALKSAGSQLEEAVKASLSHLPGEDHASPWLRTGKLHDSVSHQSDDHVLAVGSDSQVAVDQEFGTRSIPPRPFLAPTAAAVGRDLIQTMARAVADTLKEQR